MVLLLTITVFLATAIGVMAVFWMIQSRGESLPHRLKEMAAPSPAEEKGWVRSIKNRFGGTLANLSGKERIKDEIVAMVTSEELAGTRMMLSQAGLRHRMAYQTYFWSRAVLPILLVLLVFIYGTGSGLPNAKIFLLVVLAAAFGYLSPLAYVRWRIRKRQGRITDSLPDALDLMVVCVEAGLGLNAAFVKISEEFRLSSPTLSEEFDIVNREMVAGKPRQEALRALTDRTGVEEVKSLVAMLIQTEKLGTSLAQSLRVHSDSLRTKRRQRAEEAAAKTTIKLVFPLVFLLFPALFVVILGPGFIQIAKVLLPAMTGNR
ncbi:MAG TPA: type II secretion system F family protein [Candidatus Aquicultoraceae bacterium]|nr:type II secretion system F family protein [Candidatus Aquicultoraceae bacterium]